MDRYAFKSPSAHDTDEVARQRNEARDSLFLSAVLTIDGLPSEQVRVRNLSAGGLMAEYPAPVMIGTPVKIELRGIGHIPGHVAWATAGRIGIAFIGQIDPLRARKPVTTKARS